MNCEKTYENVAVLIPCYNESQTIQNVITDFQKCLPKSKIYVYDNNSTDGTDEIAKKCGAKVYYEYHQGKGNVVRRMFREIEADCYVMVDGDSTYPAKSAPEMAELVLKHNADMVVGDRLSSTYFQENKRPFHNMGNTVVMKSINILFKSNIKDVMTGYRAFSRNFVKTFPVLTKQFEIETEMTIHALDKNMNVENVIIEYSDRPNGSVSKLNTVSDGIKVLKTIVKMFAIYKPLLFWGGISFLLMIIAIAFFIPILTTFIKTGVVAKFPTLIVSCFTATISIISCFSGIILQTLRHSEKQNFEYRLIQVEKENRKND